MHKFVTWKIKKSVRIGSYNMYCDFERDNKEVYIASCWEFSALHRVQNTLISPNLWAGFWRKSPGFQFHIYSVGFIQGYWIHFWGCMNRQPLIFNWPFCFLQESSKWPLLSVEVIPRLQPTLAVVLMSGRSHHSVLKPTTEQA